jgi:hypothetical protein
MLGERRLREEQSACDGNRFVERDAHSLRWSDNARFHEIQVFSVSSVETAVTLATAHAVHYDSSIHIGVFRSHKTHLYVAKWLFDIFLDDFFVIALE